MCRSFYRTHKNTQCFRSIEYSNQGSFARLHPTSQHPPHCDVNEVAVEVISLTLSQTNDNSSVDKLR